MSSMKNLDQMVQEASMTQEEYEANRDMINRHLHGELATQDLPQHLRDVLFQWEIEENELTPRDIPQPWEDNDA